MRSAVHFRAATDELSPGYSRLRVFMARLSMMTPVMAVPAASVAEEMSRGLRVPVPSWRSVRAVQERRLLACMSLPDARSGLKMVPWPPADAVLLWFFEAVD